MASEGFSLSQLAKYLRRKGIVNRNTNMPFTTRGLHFMLRNPTYIGYIHRLGKLAKSAQINPQVDQADWDKVQHHLSYRNVKRDLDTSKSYNSPIAGLMKCHFCGCSIVTDRTIKQNKTYVYLRCSNGKKTKEPDFYLKRYGQKNCVQPYNSEEGVIEAIDELINTLWIDETILVWLEQELKALKEHDDKVIKKKQDSLKREKES